MKIELLGDDVIGSSIEWPDVQPTWTLLDFNTKLRLFLLSRGFNPLPAYFLCDHRNKQRFTAPSTTPIQGLTIVTERKVYLARVGQTATNVLGRGPRPGVGAPASWMTQMRNFWGNLLSVTLPQVVAAVSGAAVGAAMTALAFGTRSCDCPTPSMTNHTLKQD